MTEFQFCNWLDPGAKKMSLKLEFGSKMRLESN